MRKKLPIKNDPTLRIVIDIKLNKLKLIMQRKVSMEAINVYSEEHTITTKTNFDTLLADFYEKYLELKFIEDFWKEQFSDAEVLEFPEVVEDED